MENKKWWHFRKLDKKDYGRIALLGIFVAALKSSLPIPINPVLDLFCEIAIIIGFFAIILWIKEQFSGNKKQICGKN